MIDIEALSRGSARYRNSSRNKCSHHSHSLPRKPPRRGQTAQPERRIARPKALTVRSRFRWSSFLLICPDLLRAVLPPANDMMLLPRGAVDFLATGQDPKVRRRYEERNSAGQIRGRTSVPDYSISRRSLVLYIDPLLVVVGDLFISA